MIAVRKRASNRMLIGGSALAFFGVFGAMSFVQNGRFQSPYYPNCDVAWSLGAAPIQQGDPGFSTSLDRDGDGVACEPYWAATADGVGEGHRAAAGDNA